MNVEQTLFVNHLPATANRSQFIQESQSTNKSQAPNCAKAANDAPTAVKQRENIPPHQKTEAAKDNSIKTDPYEASHETHFKDQLKDKITSKNSTQGEKTTDKKLQNEAKNAPNNLTQAGSADIPITETPIAEKTKNNKQFNTTETNEKQIHTHLRKPSVETIAESGQHGILKPAVHPKKLNEDASINSQSDEALQKSGVKTTQAETQQRQVPLQTKPKEALQADSNKPTSQQKTGPQVADKNIQAPFNGPVKSAPNVVSTEKSEHQTITDQSQSVQTKNHIPQNTSNGLTEQTDSKSDPNSENEQTQNNPMMFSADKAQEASDFKPAHTQQTIEFEKQGHSVTPGQSSKAQMLDTTSVDSGTANQNVMGIERPSASANSTPISQPGSTPPPVAQQLQQPMITLIQQSRQQITIQLNPPELGKVAIKFDSENGQVTGLLQVAKPQTRAEIEHALPEIIQNLNQAGVQVKQINVVLTPQQQSQSKDQFIDQFMHEQTDSDSRQESDTHAFEQDHPSGDSRSGQNRYVYSQYAFSAESSPASYYTDESVNLLV